MKKLFTAPRISANRGFTLLEVLVATVILAVGLLGISALQVTGLRSNFSSLVRSQATLSAYDMSDRMRANGEAFLTGVAYYDNPVSAANANCLTVTGCDSQEMAENDMFAWNAELANALPSGEGVVCIDSTPLDGAFSASPACDGVGSGYAIKIWWRDSRDNTAPLKRFVVTYLK